MSSVDLALMQKAVERRAERVLERIEKKLADA